MNEFLKPQLDYLYFLQNLRETTGHCFDGFFSFVTTLAEYFIPILVITFLYWVYNKKYGMFLVLSLCTSVFFNQLFKVTACIYRPWILDSRIHPVPSAMEMASGYSFPSGHTATATAIWGSLARILKSNKFISFSLVALILLIGFSRNYLGVHTPQDVLVSLFVGIFVVLGVEKVLNWIEKDTKNDLIAYTIYVIAIICLIFYANLKPYPMDYLNGQLIVDPYKVIKDIFPLTGMVLGLSTGWILDRRFIKYEISGKWYSKLFKYILGNTLIILAFTYLKPYLMTAWGYKAGYFSFNFILGSFVTAIYPYLMQKFPNLFLSIKTKDVS